MTDAASSHSSSPRGFGLEGRAVLVFGASRGIGEAIVRAFAAQGSRVMLASRNLAALQGLCAELDPSGRRVLAVRADMNSPEDVAGAVEATVQAFGALDVAVNNAGIQTSRQPFIDTPVEAFDEIIGVNLRGVFLAMKSEIRAMLQSGGGSIINLASIAGVRGLPLLAPYTASKHGVVGLTRSGAIEYSEHGIRVNAIVPGTIMTEMLKAGPLSTPESTARIMSKIPMRRVAQVDELTGAVLWLASDLASYVTGVMLPVDGGYTVG